MHLQADAGDTRLAGVAADVAAAVAAAADNSSAVAAVKSGIVGVGFAVEFVVEFVDAAAADAVDLVVSIPGCSADVVLGTAVAVVADDDIVVADDATAGLHFEPKG